MTLRFDPSAGTYDALIGKSDDAALFLAVIRQHIDDATSPHPACAHNGKRAAEIRQEARDWLLKPDTGFEEVCALAGVGPRDVRNAALAKIEAFDANPENLKRRPPSRRRYYTAFGETHSVKEWSKIVGVHAASIQSRLRLGLSIEEALSGSRRPSRVASRYSYGGVSLTLDQWADRLGIPRATLVARIGKLGWSFERAITTPAKRRGVARKQAESQRTGAHPFAQESAKLEFSE
jgi:hypothetical protein